MGVVIIFSSTVAYGNLQCEGLFLEPTHLTDIDIPLLQAAKSHVEPLTMKDVFRENLELIATHSEYIPSSSSKRAKGIDSAQGQKIIEAVARSPFLGTDPVLYQRPQTEIGYCFGRATFIHLMLLRLGVQKESIKKIWIVGPMKIPGTNLIWDYHVATMVFSEKQGWMVLDSNIGRPVTIDNWFSNYYHMSVDRRAKLFVTDASKFAPDLGKYDRVQLGLNMSREQDWYQHYFKDLMRYVGQKPLSDFGLKSIK
ncbi:MAG: protein-glutamine glutaminase family protein [Bdellovibrionia bacterium]